MRGRKRSGFTLIELLVVISIVVLLMAMLLPTLSRARRQARAVLCQANLKQWGVVFAAYLAENHSAFPQTEGSEWIYSLRPYYADSNDLLLCPMASQPTYRDYRPDDEYPSRHGDTFRAWGPLKYEGRERLYGSYSMNGWLYLPNASYAPFAWAGHVRQRPDIPVLTEWVNTVVAPSGGEVPPEGDGFQWWNVTVSMEACINRHDGGVNGLFLDWSVRKIGLKELWTFKWHRQFDTAGPWTTAGGVTPGDWPHWMKGFEEY